MFIYVFKYLRSRILEDRSLRIRKVKVQDEGIYICRVGNSVSWQEVEFRLSVLGKTHVGVVFETSCVYIVQFLLNFVMFFCPLAGHLFYPNYAL